MSCWCWWSIKSEVHLLLWLLLLLPIVVTWLCRHGIAMGAAPAPFAQACVATDAAAAAAAGAGGGAVGLITDYVEILNGGAVMRLSWSDISGSTFDSNRAIGTGGGAMVATLFDPNR